METIVDQNICTKILSKRYPGSALQSFKVRSFEEEDVSGLIGQHFKLRINFMRRNEEKILDVFMKTLDENSPTMYKISKDLLMYEKEALIFTQLLPHFDDIGIDVTFAPESYLCEKDTVFIEDLSSTGFKMSPKNKPLNLAECKNCLATVAKFHVASMLYEFCEAKNRNCPYSLKDEFRDLLQDLVFSEVENYGTKYITKSIEGLIILSDEEFKEDHDLEEFKKNLLSSLETDDKEDSSKMHCTILHGDLWSNNFLHKYVNDEYKETKLIDYQLINYGPPAKDVLQFIYSNTRKEFRDKYFGELLEHYYRKLGEFLHERALNVEDFLPRAEYYTSCERFKVFAKLQCTIDRTITMIPDDIYRNTLMVDDIFHDFIFINRGDYLTKFYRTIPDYKEVIQEDLQELKCLLLGDNL